MTEVTPQVGYYYVQMVNADHIRTHLVGKDKHCSCGGSADRKCSHIRAVADYLRSGGSPAPPCTDQLVRDGHPEKAAPDSCPICGASLSHRRNGFWRCSRDTAHYFQWRGEQKGGAIRKFLTQPHPAKRGAFYAMSDEERKAFLIQAARRMHKGGYTPHS